MNKSLLTMILAAAIALPAMAQDPEVKSFTVGNFDEPTTEDAHEGDGSWWERAPFQWYSVFSGNQIFYTADQLAPLAEQPSKITEVAFKYGDEGAFCVLEADLNLLIENTSADQFYKNPDTQQYEWYTYDPTAPSSSLKYEVELYYMEDQEIHFVLDRPLEYAGENLVITMWSQRTSEEEVNSSVTLTYAVKTNAYTNMSYGDDYDSFQVCYDSGVQADAQAPRKLVPVAKFYYTQGTDGITSVAADTAAPVRLYNLQGVEINPDTAPAGIYIRRQGATATKISIR